VLNLLRIMTKLYVGGLPFRFTEDDLRGLCEKYGDIEDGNA